MYSCVGGFLFFFKQHSWTQNASDPNANGGFFECTNKPPHTKGPVLCGLDLEDGWPWSNRYFGKGGASGSWIHSFPIPFTRSFRATVQIACGDPDACATVPVELRRPDILASQTAHGLVMVRGLVGNDDEISLSLSGGGIAVLPKIGRERLRMRLSRRLSTPVAPGAMVPLLDHSGGSANESGFVLAVAVGFQLGAVIVVGEGAHTTILRVPPATLRISHEYLNEYVSSIALRGLFLMPVLRDSCSHGGP